MSNIHISLFSLAKRQKNQTMTYLSWLADTDLENEVRQILNTANSALKKTEKDLNRNVIDPFSPLFEMSGFGIDSMQTWRRTEQIRQAQKTLANAFGTFHQQLLGKVAGWENLGTGNNVDLHCAGRKIIAELKNKYNTVKGSDQVGVYDSLHDLVMPNASIYKGYTAYYVEIIPKHPQRYDEAFTPPDKTTGTHRTASAQIRRIDGQSFYALVTGETDALRQLYAVLPQVIQHVSSHTFTPTDIAALQGFFDAAYLA